MFTFFFYSNFLFLAKINIKIHVSLCKRYFIWICMKTYKNVLIIMKSLTVHIKNIVNMNGDLQTSEINNLWFVGYHNHNIQWNLSKPNLTGTNFCVQNRQVFSLYRIFCVQNRQVYTGTQFIKVSLHHYCLTFTSFIYLLKLIPFFQNIKLRFISSNI